MLIKKRLIKRLVSLAITFFILFIVASGAYLYLSYASKMNAVEVSLNFLKVFIIGDDNGNFAKILDNLSGMRAIFLAELIIFAITAISLLATIWHLTELYLVQKRNAYIDPLTDIYNKRAILFGLKDEISRAVRYNHYLSIAIFDLDYFKRFNDTNGHVAGDVLLKKFAKLLRKSIRDMDWVGRFGGEEFLAVFPETAIKQAADVCERIRKKVEQTEFAGRDKMPNKKITVSIGVAEFKGKRIIRRSRFVDIADKRLYRAKEAGRNQVVWE